MANAKRLPSGNWRAQVYIGKDISGKRIIKSVTAPTKRETEYLAAELLSRTDASRFVTHDKNMTIGDAVDQYIDSKDGVISPSSVQGYRRHRRTRYAALMAVPLDKVNNRQLQMAINAECKLTTRRGSKISPKTIIDSFSVVSAAIRMFRPNFNVKVTLPSKIPQIKELPPPEVVFNIIRGSSVELPALLAMWLSFSMSEIRGIKWSSITEYDDGSAYITIQNSIIDIDGKPFEKKSTKVDTRTRRLRIPKYILNLIHSTERTSEYLINLSGSAIYQRFTRLIEKNGLQHMTFHDLRHMNASVMSLLKIPDKYALERGGWRTDQVMKRVYQHTFSEEREKVDNRIDEYFNSILEGSSHESSHKK